MVTLEVMSLASGHLYTVALISVQSRGQDRFFSFFNPLLLGSERLRQPQQQIE